MEFHPYLYQWDLLQFCAAKGIVLEAYSPLTAGARLNDPKLAAVARKYPAATKSSAERQPVSSKSTAAQASATKSPAQILIRWALQRGLVVIPKSAKRQRIFENGDVFDFHLSEADMRVIDSFNENLRTCWDPTNAP